MAPELSCEMNHENCLVHRVGNYPLIAGLTNHALNGYNASKEYSPLLKATLDLSEAWTRYCLNTAYPLYLRFEKPIEKASAYAVSALPTIESACPALNMTPEELAVASRERFYTGSLLERSIAGVKATPTVASQKAEAAAEMAALVAAQGKEKALKLIHTGVVGLNVVLDTAERYLVYFHYYCVFFNKS